MKEERVTRTLQEIAEREIPDNLNLWPALQARLRLRPRRLRWEQLVPATRPGWALLALALLLAVSTVSYAVVPVVNRLFQQEVGLSHVEQAGLSQEIDLSQTVDGVTVTLERAYADVNRIVVGVTLSAPGGQRYDPHSITLSDARGTVFPPTTGLGVTGRSDILDVSLPPGEGGYVLSFDASGLRDTPPILNLHLEVMLSEFILPAADPTVLPRPEELTGAAADSKVVVLSPQPREVKPVGPFAFDFALPLHSGHLIELGQIVEAAGIPVEVRQVMVAPSESRVLLCLKPPDGEWERWAAVATLSTEKGQAEVAWSANPEAGCAVHAFLPSLYGQEGDWTLTVDELIRFFTVPGKDQTRVKGPWVFHFHVP